MTKNLSEEMQRNARQALAGLTPHRQGEEAGGLPVQRLVAAFFRSRYLVFGTTLFGVLIGMFMAITTPNNYVSTGMFSFSSSGAESRSVDPMQAKETSQESIATGAAYILNSDDLLIRVIKRLTPQRILQPYQPTGEGQGSAKELFFKIQRDWNAVDESNMTSEEALKRLQKTIAVARPQFTDVLIATCNANNPELAREILSTYMDEAILWHIEKYDDQKAYEAAKAAAQQGILDLTAAQHAMREFLDRKAQVADFDSSKKAAEADSIEAQSRLNGFMDDVAIKTAQKKHWDELLADPEKLPPTKKQRVRRGATSEVKNDLNKRLGDALIKLSELKRTYSNQQALEIKGQEALIKDIQASIAGMATSDDKDTWTEELIDNPVYLSAITDRDKLERELVGLEATVKHAQELHKRYDDTLKKLVTLEPEFSTLRDSLVRAQEDKVHVQSLWEAVQKKKLLGLGKFSVLDEVQAASLPLEKEGPNRGKLLIGGLFVGLFLGLGLVVLRALPDRIVRTREDLDGIEGLAVIGIVPRLDRTNLRRHVTMREQGW